MRKITLILPWLIMTGCADDPNPAPPQGVAVGLAVVCSDYQSSSVSLLSLEGELVAEGCISSGSRDPALMQALSGDVALPSSPSHGNELVIIDRTLGVLTFVDPSSCAPRAQLDVSTGFLANPHDVVSLSPTKAYVTRAGHNLNPTALETDHDEGSDVLVIDPTIPAITGRIDLLPHTPQVDGTFILPRADRAVLAKGKVFLTMNAQDASYAVTAPARLVWIDPETDTVTGTLELPGFANCGALTYARDDETLIVACSGEIDFLTFQTTGSGVVAIDLTAAEPLILASAGPQAFDDRPVSGFALAALSATRVFAVTMGEFGGPGDALWAMALPGDRGTSVWEASSVFQLSGLYADRDSERVMLTDGSSTTPLVHVFDASGAALTKLSAIDPSPVLALPPRAIAAY